MSLAVGEILDGKYRIVRILGVGGMGEVYEGENTRIHRKVAIKVLHANVAQKADIVQRFEREAQAAGRIGSEHIVEVLDLGNLASGERYMVMEYLDGESLTQRIKVRGRLPSADLANLLRQLLEGLGAAHVAGIVHRDLKPDNIYVVKRSGQEFVKILDFGVSKFTLMGEELSMTKTGAVMGTPYYMSPEQARGQPIDQRSDLYSVGVVAYQALTGRVPFNAETFNELIFKIALESPEPIERVAPGVDQGIAAIVRKSMERDPAHRFQNATEFAHAVDAYRGVAQQQHQQQQHGQQQHHQGQQQEYPQAGGYGQPSLAQLQNSQLQNSQLQNSQLQNSQPGHAQPGHPQLTHSQAGLAQSGGHLGQSGSNPGFNAAQMRQSQANLNQSGTSAPRPYPSAPNGIHPMGQSQVGLAVTAGQPKKGAPVLLIALSVMAALGVGGGFAFYRMSASEAKPASTGEPKSTAAATSETTATATATAPQTATAASTESAPTASQTASETASASAAPEPTGKLVRVPGKLPTAKPEVTAKPVPTPTGVGGRPISDKL